MKHITLSLPKGWMTALLIMCFVGAANAQKLKSSQEISVRAPAGAKADAKLGEWGELQAYNKATQLYYTLANDDKNLFLVVKISDATNINKVLAGGIDLTINTAGKKKDKDAFIITFPVVNRNAMRNAMRSRGGGGGGFGGGGGAQPGAPVDSAVILAMRKQAISAIKEIKVLGFKEITDTLISIYNEYSIKAVVNYDEKGELVYELSLPLSLLKISTDAPKEFAYNLKVNGLQIPNRGGFGGGGGGGFNGGGGGGGGRNGGGGGGGNAGGGGGGVRAGGGGFNMEEMTTPTDFWGKYTLAKP